jgi:hypothetical protein
MKQRLLLITLSIIGFAGVAISILWLIPSILFSPSGTRAWKIIVAYDMLTNASTGGDDGETISRRAYLASLKGNRVGCVVCKFLDFLNKDHCKNS